MTFEQLQEIVDSLMKYTSPDADVHRLDIGFVADGVRGALIEQWVQKHGMSSLSQFATDLYLPVQPISQRGLPYIDFGAQVLGLENNAGIIDLGMPQEYDNSFTLIRGGMASTYSHLEAGQNLGKVMGFMVGTQIFFKYLNLGQETIRVTAIPALFGITDPNFQIPMPLEFTDALTQGLRARFQEIKHTATDNVAGGRAVIEGNKQPIQQQ